MLRVSYINPNGGHMVKGFNDPEEMGRELERLCDRRIAAEAWHDSDRDSLVGCVWKNEGRWAYFYDTETP